MARYNRDEYVSLGSWELDRDYREIQKRRADRKRQMRVVWSVGVILGTSTALGILDAFAEGWDGILAFILALIISSAVVVVFWAVREVIGDIWRGDF